MRLSEKLTRWAACVKCPMSAEGLCHRTIEVSSMVNDPDAVCPLGAWKLPPVPAIPPEVIALADVRQAVCLRCSYYLPIEERCRACRGAKGCLRARQLSEHGRCPKGKW